MISGINIHDPTSAHGLDLVHCPKSPNWLISPMLKNKD